MKPYIVFLSALIVLAVLIYGVVAGPSLFGPSAQSRVLPYAIVLETKNADQDNILQTAPVVNPFDGLSLEAKSAFVFDLISEQPVFSYNADAQLPLASLTKLMTALLAKETLPVNVAITVSKKAVLQDGDEGFRPGELWDAQNLINAMLVGSSNDAAFAVAEEIEKDIELASSRGASDNRGLNQFVLLMDKRALELGLYSSYFLNPTGLDVSKNIAGGYGSARDVAMLTKNILEKYPSLLDVTKEPLIKITSFDNREIGIKNTNAVLASARGLIAGKTGFTDLAGGNLMVIFDAGFNRPFIAVVLGSSFEGRFSDMIKLMEATFDYYRQ